MSLFETFDSESEEILRPDMIFKNMVIPLTHHR